MSQPTGEFLVSRLHAWGGAAWDEALAAREPAVISVRTVPDAPPRPPHVTLDQGRKFMSTLQQGDPDQSCMIEDAVGQVLAAVTGRSAD